MTNIIDRRLNPRDKTIKNRQRFIERSKHQIKKIVKDSINSGNITDIEKGKIKIKAKNINEPSFGVNPRTGDKNYILPGNKKYIVGDKEPKPSGKSSDGSGNKGSPDGESEDTFEFVLNDNEYLNFIFEDLELPDLVKKQIKDVIKFSLHRTGFKNQGNPAQLDYVRSLKNGLARRIGLKRPKNEDLIKLEFDLQFAKENGEDTKDLETQIEEIKRRQKVVPWLDPFDMRYRNFELKPFPMSKAVMFCVMDVSVSMGQDEKDIAKRFFFLLYMFLRRKYTKVDIRFIRHHSTAKEVQEEEFFYGKDTGGTVVSTSIKLVNDIIKDEYDVNEWNIYCAQASDGDNTTSDNNELTAEMHDLLNKIQYHAYIEIKLNQNHLFAGLSDLWKTYGYLQHTHKNIQSKRVFGVSDIWPVFKELFSKERTQ